MIDRIVWQGGARDGAWVGVRVGRLALRWDSRLVSSAHPLLDECCVRLDGDVFYGGFMVRLWPRRTNRRTRGVAVMWRGAHPLTPRHRRAARSRAKSTRLVSSADGMAIGGERPGCGP